MPQQYIDFAFVKEHASFEPVLAHYNLQLVGRGKDRAVLCPFHRERKPSCKIELERRVFHCFGCEAKGNILEFVARLERNPKDLARGGNHARRNLRDRTGAAARRCRSARQREASPSHRIGAGGPAGG